jgi:hypothetical protein
VPQLTLTRRKLYKGGGASYAIAGLRGSIYATRQLFAGEPPESITIESDVLGTPIDKSEAKAKRAEERAARKAERAAAKEAKKAEREAAKQAKAAEKAEKKAQRDQARADKRAAKAAAKRTAASSESEGASASL